MERRKDAVPVVINKTEQMFGLSDQDFPSASKINSKFSGNQLKKWKISANRLEIIGLRSRVADINKLAGGLAGGNGGLRDHGNRRTQHLCPWDLRRMGAVCGTEKMLEERVVEKE